MRLLACANNSMCPVAVRQVFIIMAAHSMSRAFFIKVKRWFPCLMWRKEVE